MHSNKTEKLSPFRVEKLLVHLMAFDIGRATGRAKILNREELIHVTRPSPSNSVDDEQIYYSARTKSEQMLSSHHHQYKNFFFPAFELTRSCTHRDTSTPSLPPKTMAFFPFVGH